MTDIYGARVRETTTTTGTGTLTLAGAVAGHKAFSTLGVGATCKYMLEDANGTSWERGTGTVGSGTLARTTVKESTNGNAAIVLSSGTHKVFVSSPTELFVRVDHYPLTVEEYGAVGDGTTDDTTAIQAALNTGAPEVRASGLYKTTASLKLKSDQMLTGVAKSLNTTLTGSPLLGSYPRIIFRPSGADKVAIKNDTSTIGNGIRDLCLDVNDNTFTAVQFASTYGNVVRDCWILGTYNIGIMAHDTYVCNFENVVMNGASVKRYNIYISEATNAVTVRKLHTTGLPNDTATCLYGVVVRGGYGHTLQDCVFQGQTIGIATGTVNAFVIDNPYFENTLCNARLGSPNSGPQGVGISVRGGTWGAPYSSHPQYSHRGPVIYYQGQRAVLDALAFNSTSSNSAGVGPWPVVLGDFGTYLMVNNAFHFGNDASAGSRALFFRETSSTSCTLTVYGGAKYSGSGVGVEFSMKDTDNYGTNMHAMAIVGGVFAYTAWQPAVIFAAVDSLLKTDLPAGSTLVL